MEIAKGFLRIIGIALIIYLFIFALWFVFEVSCLQYTAQHNWESSECGQDSFTRIITKTHSPVINLIHWITIYE